MADAVTTNVLFSGTKRYNVVLTNVSDGTGETNVVKIDKSTLTGPEGAEPGSIAIEYIEWDIQGFDYVKLAWDHTADDTALVLYGGGLMDMTDRSKLIDPASAGGTGDLLLTTSGLGATFSYTIHLRCILKGSV